MRFVFDVGIDTGSIDESERIGLRISSCRRIVVAMPVVIESGFELEPLSREPCIERLGSDDGVRCSPWRPDRIPHRSLARIGHAHWTVEMIDVDIERCG